MVASAAARRLRDRSAPRRPTVPYPAPSFELIVELHDNHTQILAVRGEIHVSTAQEFRRRLDDVLAMGLRRIVLDLSDTTFIDSTGLSILLNALRRIHRMRGRLTIVCPNPTVLRLFHVTRLETTFDIVPTREEALARVQS
jgi:anti-sigma B factor antagonist